MLAITSVAARTDPIVGRRSELEQLDAALEALEAGAPACLAVEGEPGIGKTRLLAELRRRAEERGHLVLSGSAAEFERDLPYGVWVEALDAYVASQEFASRAARTPSSCPTSPGSCRRFESGTARPPRRSATSAIARIAPCGGSWRWSPNAIRSSSCSTTCTGATPRRSSSSPPSCAGAWRRACCSRSAIARDGRPRD